MRHFPYFGIDFLIDFVPAPPTWTPKRGYGCWSLSYKSLSQVAFKSYSRGMLCVIRTQRMQCVISGWLADVERRCEKGRQNSRHGRALVMLMLVLALMSPTMAMDCRMTKGHSISNSWGRMRSVAISCAEMRPNQRMMPRNLKVELFGGGKQPMLTKCGACRETTEFGSLHTQTVPEQSSDQMWQHTRLRLRGGGIAGFQRWCMSQFPSAVIEVAPGQSDVFDHVCFDMNGLLHTACRKANSIEHAVAQFSPVHLRSCSYVVSTDTSWLRRTLQRA